MISCSPDSSTPESATTPARSSAVRTRVDSSAAALRVKVRPSTCSGRTAPVPTSQTTRAAITVVLPDPAPAMITPGSSGAVMASSWAAEKGTPRASMAGRRGGAGTGRRDGSGRRGEPALETGHDTTCRPAGWAGQLPRNGQ